MLSVNNLYKKYADREVFNTISFSIPQKAIVSLFGKNGQGKTTLLKIISGQIKYEGRITYNGISLENDYNEFIKKVVLINNSDFLYSHLSLMEHISLIKNLSDSEVLADELLDELIDILGVSEYKDMYIKNLSLGTKQKMQIITSLLTKPKVILFDEPFVNLDEKSVINLLRFLEEYNEKNNGIIIFSTHSRDEKLQKFSNYRMELLDKDMVRLEAINVYN